MKRINHRIEDFPPPWEIDPDDDASLSDLFDPDDDRQWAARFEARSHRANRRRYAGGRRRLRSRWDLDDWDQ